MALSMISFLACIDHVTSLSRVSFKDSETMEARLMALMSELQMYAEKPTLHHDVLIIDSIKTPPEHHQDLRTVGGLDSSEYNRLRS